MNTSQSINLVAGLTPREAGEAILARHPVQPTATIQYLSHGRLLVVGDVLAITAVMERLPSWPAIFMAVTESLPGTLESQLLGQGFRVCDDLGQITLTGWLGEFRGTAQRAGTTLCLEDWFRLAPAGFDLVLDLCEPLLTPFPVAPIGYFAVGASRGRKLAETLTELPLCMGELTKPQYVQIDNTACDHVQAGVACCSRCLKVCETWAIATVDQTITLNPYLCQGCGDCATICPTGAFAYAYPPLEQALLRVGVMLRVYAEQGGKTPIVLLHDGSKGRDWVLAHRAQLPINVLTYSIEALGATGMEFWLMVLAQGAAQVLILDTGDMHAKTRLLLQTQLKAAQTIVQALGYPANLLRLVEPDAVMATMLPVRALRRVAPLPSDVGVHDKRSVIRCAIQHLQAGTAPPASTPLPEGSFFGAVRVDTKACTRCLDCVALCPESALVEAEDGRGLAFIEARCIQCDGCVSGCPEQAIQLEPRYLFDLTAALSPKVIMSDQVI